MHFFLLKNKFPYSVYIPNLAERLLWQSPKEYPMKPKLHDNPMYSVLELSESLKYSTTLKWLHKIWSKNE